MPDHHVAATRDDAANELQVWPQTVTPVSGTMFLAVAEVVLPSSDGTLCGNERGVAS